MHILSPWIMYAFQFPSQPLDSWLWLHSTVVYRARPLLCFVIMGSNSPPLLPVTVERKRDRCSIRLEYYSVWCWYIYYIRMHEIDGVKRVVTCCRTSTCCVRQVSVESPESSVVTWCQKSDSEAPRAGATRSFAERRKSVRANYTTATSNVATTDEQRDDRSFDGREARNSC